MIKKRRKKQRFPKDPFAEREAGKYETPIPSREFIMSVLADSSQLMNREELAYGFGLSREEDIEALRQGLTQVEFLDISGAGHFIFEEQPEAVAEAVRLMVIRLGDTLPTSDGTASVTGHDGGSDLVQPSSIGQ